MVSTSGALDIAWNANAENNIAGYRVHYGTVSGQHTEIHDAGNATEASLQSVLAGTTYYCALTAYNVVGLESSKSSEISVIFEDNGSAGESQLVVLEPEAGNVSGAIYKGLELDEYFQPTIGFVEALDSEDEGHAEMVFSTPAAGTYQVWARVKAPSSGSDSILLGINGPSEQIYHLVAPGDAHSPDWTWKRIEYSPGIPLTADLFAGEHLLVFSKEDPFVLIDRIVLSTDLNFVPTDAYFNDPEVVVITSHPETEVASAGAPLLLGVDVVTTGDPSFQWIKDGTPIVGATSSSYLLPIVANQDSGVYCVEVQASASYAMSNPATISVVPPELVLDSVSVSPAAILGVATSGTVGAAINVEGSSDLSSWSNLGPGVVGSPVSVPDPDATTAARRFYRISLRNP